MTDKQHDKTDHHRRFQLERLILFSDAVFAIAITLLIIEIKIPSFDHRISGHELGEALLEKLPEFIGFMISFAVIGQFWTGHHRLFGYVSNYTGGLLWLNLLMLFWIVLMPFSNHLNMQYGNLDITWCWYSMNLALTELSVLFIWRYLARHPELTILPQDKNFMRHNFLSSFWVLLIFLSGALLTCLPWLWAKWVSRFIFFLIFPVLSVHRRRYGKNKKPA